MEGRVTPRPLPTQIFTVISVFPSAEVDNRQVPGPAWPQAGPRTASSGPRAACADCARSHPGRALSYPAGQPAVGCSPRVAARPPHQAGQRGQGWPKAHGKAAGAIAGLGVSSGPLPTATSGTGLPARALGRSPREGGTHDVMIQLTARW